MDRDRLLAELRPQILSPEWLDLAKKYAVRNQDWDFLGQVENLLPEMLEAIKGTQKQIQNVRRDLLIQERISSLGALSIGHSITYHLVGGWHRVEILCGIPLPERRDPLLIGGPESFNSLCKGCISSSKIIGEGRITEWKEGEHRVRRLLFSIWAQVIGFGFNEPFGIRTVHLKDPYKAQLLCDSEVKIRSLQRNSGASVGKTKCKECLEKVNLGDLIRVSQKLASKARKKRTARK